jgi:hypothetical protein
MSFIIILHFITTVCVQFCGSVQKLSLPGKKRTDCDAPPTEPIKTTTDRPVCIRCWIAQACGSVGKSKSAEGVVN